MSLIDNGQMVGSFQGSSSYVPMVGIILNKYEEYQSLGQYKYDIAPGAGQAVAGDPVVVSNRAGGASTAAIEGLNAMCGTISAKSATVPTIDGFLAQSPTDIVPLAGGEAYPVQGLLSSVALVGSRLRMWLPSTYAALANTEIGTPLTYDFSTGIVRPWVTGQTPAEVVLPVKLLSALVAAKKLVYNNGTGKAVWTDCFAVMVEL